MDTMKNAVKEESKKDLELVLSEKISELESQGFTVEFGTIGTRTTYALLSNQSTKEEYVGWSYVKDVNFYKEVVGKLKSLQQAVARMKMLKDRAAKAAAKNNE